MKKVFIITGIVIMAIIAMVCVNGSDSDGQAAPQKCTHTDNLIHDYDIMDAHIQYEYGLAYYGRLRREKNTDQVHYDVYTYGAEGEEWVGFGWCDRSYYRYKYFGE